MKRIFSYLAILLFFISCSKDCYKAPEPIIFEFINTAGENLIQNGSLTQFAISEDNNSNITPGVQLTKTNDNKIILERVGSFDGTKNYKFYSTIKFFNFSIESSKATDGCDGYQIRGVDFKNITATKEGNYYRIILE